MNWHHTQYPRCQHEAHFATRKIRQNQTLIVPMDEEVESHLHKEVPVIPVLDPVTAMNVLKIWTPQSTHIRSIYNLMSSIEEAIQHPKSKPIQKILGQLTVHALESQLPYIRIGQLTDEVGDIR